MKKELIAKKSNLGLWKVNDSSSIVYRITVDGSGHCNSIEAIQGYYKNGADEVGLVNEIINRGNNVEFYNIDKGDEAASYTEYLEQFNNEDGFPIYPYVNFETYEKAKEIWDLLNE